MIDTHQTAIIKRARPLIREQLFERACHPGGRLSLQHISEQRLFEQRHMLLDGCEVIGDAIRHSKTIAPWPLFDIRLDAILPLLRRRVLEEDRLVAGRANIGRRQTKHVLVDGVLVIEARDDSAVAHLSAAQRMDAFAQMALDDHQQRRAHLLPGNPTSLFFRLQRIMRALQRCQQNRPERRLGVSLRHPFILIGRGGSAPECGFRRDIGAYPRQIIRAAAVTDDANLPPIGDVACDGIFAELGVVFVAQSAQAHPNDRPAVAFERYGRCIRIAISQGGVGVTILELRRGALLEDHRLRLGFRLHDQRLFIIEQRCRRRSRLPGVCSDLLSRLPLDVSLSLRVSRLLRAGPAYHMVLHGPHRLPVDEHSPKRQNETDDAEDYTQRLCAWREIRDRPCIRTHGERHQQNRRHDSKPAQPQSPANASGVFRVGDRDGEAIPILLPPIELSGMRMSGPEEPRQRRRAFRFRRGACCSCRWKGGGRTNRRLISLLPIGAWCGGAPVHWRHVRWSGRCGCGLLWLIAKALLGKLRKLGRLGRLWLLRGYAKRLHLRRRLTGHWRLTKRSALRWVARRVGGKQLSRAWPLHRLGRPGGLLRLLALLPSLIGGRSCALFRAGWLERIRGVLGIHWALPPWVTA